VLYAGSCHLALSDEETKPQHGPDSGVLSRKREDDEPALTTSCERGLGGSGRPKIVREIDYTESKSSTVLVELCGGSDGARIITYDFSDLKLHERQEILAPIVLPLNMNSQGRYVVPRTQIPIDQWTEVARRHANGQSLRQLAKLYGVSYEAVRQVLKRQSQTMVVVGP
jgi:hypothetical protein